MRSILASFPLLAAAATVVACSSGAAPSEEQQQSAALVGSTTVLASHQTPGDLALDATRVYWTNFGSAVTDGSIVSVSKLGGAPVTLATKQSVPFGIAVDDTQVYWVNYDAGGPNGALMAVPKNGGSPKVLAATADGPRTVVVDATRAYFLTSRAVVAVGKHGGTPVEVTSTQCGGGIAQDDANIYWVVNCVMFPPQGIFKAPKSGGPAVKLSDEAPGKITVASDGIYWMTGDGIVKKVSKLGGPTFPVGAFPSPSSDTFTLDSSSFYATSSTSLVKTSRFLGTSATLAKGATPIGGIAVDGTYVYWAWFGPGDARILRALKF